MPAAVPPPVPPPVPAPDPAPDPTGDPAGHPTAAGDGPGFRATVAALAVGQVLNWAVLYYAYSALLLPMQRGLGWSQATLMGAFTLGLAVSGLATYAVGAAIDAGRGRAVMTAGCALGALGTAVWALMREPWMFYAVWAVLGVASAACLYEPAFSVLTKRYPTRYREGITLLTLLGGFASTLCFPAVAGLQRLGLDWRQVLWVCSGVMAAMVPLHLWALRGPMLVAHPHAEASARDATLNEALRRRDFWMLTVCFTAFAFIQATLWAHVMPIFESKAMAAADTVLVLMVVGPAQVAGRLVFAAIGHGRSLRRLGFAVLLALAGSLVILALGRSLAVLIVFALVFGLANGLITIVRGGLVPEYFGRSEVGRISGLMSGVGQVARAAAPVAATLLLALVGGYGGLVGLLAGLGFFAVLTYWRAGPPRRAALQAHAVLPAAADAPGRPLAPEAPPPPAGQGTGPAQPARGPRPASGD